MRQKTPLEKVLEELQGKKLNETYEAFKDAARFMYQQKKAFVDSGFTESQAMEIVVADYLDNKQIAREAN